MVYFDKTDIEKNIWELANLDDKSVRIIIPVLNKYFILATSRVVRTNQGIKRKIESGSVVLYHTSLETLIELLITHKAHHKMDLLRSIAYESYHLT